MNEALYLLTGIAVGVGLATTVYIRRMVRLDTRNMNIINVPARSVSVDALIESALGHTPLPRGSSIHDIPRQSARHRAADEEPSNPPVVLWPREGDQVTE